MTDQLCSVCLVAVQTLSRLRRWACLVTGVKMLKCAAAESVSHLAIRVSDLKRCPQSLRLKFLHVEASHGSSLSVIIRQRLSSRLFNGAWLSKVLCSGYQVYSVLIKFCTVCASSHLSSRQQCTCLVTKRVKLPHPVTSLLRRCIIDLPHPVMNWSI